MKKELKEYAELKLEEKRIKARMAELNPTILNFMMESNFDKIDSPIGDFIIKKMKRWTFTPVVAELENDLENLKDAEKANGKATFREVEQLEFRENKKDDN